MKYSKGMMKYSKEIQGGYYSVDWSTGLEYWTGLDYWTHILLVFTHSEVTLLCLC